MNVRHTLICFFFLSGHTGRINTKMPIITGKEGGTIRHQCKFILFGRWKALFKENNSLIETFENRAQRGRYSLEYAPGRIISKSLLYVRITNLTNSDSGLYRCVLDPIWLPKATEEFEVRVEDDINTPTSTQTPAARPGTLPYVRLTLFIIIFISSAAVLIYCRKTGCEPEGPPQEAEYANVTEADRVYEEIREEDRQSRSPPVEISANHAQAKYTKPKAAEGTDKYSLVTAVSSQMDTEDDSSKLTYSVVHLYNGTAAPLNSAPRGDADNAAYSVLQAAASSDDRHAEHASAPLYSTVNLHQQ